MPVEVPSLRGKADYDVERVIRELAGAVNALEKSPSAAAFAAVQSTLSRAQSAVTTLQQRVEVLEGKVAILEAQP